MIPSPRLPLGSLSLASLPLALLSLASLPLASLFLVIAFCAAMPQAALGAAIQPAFADYIATLGDQDPVSAILFLREQAPIGSIDAALKAERATRRERHERIVTALREASASQTELLALLAEQQRHGEVIGYTPYWISNLIVVQATKACIQSLSQRADIDIIEPNFTTHLIEPVGQRHPGTGAGGRGIGVTPGLRAINADRVWSELGITGAGRLLANCDTGVDGAHPALADRWRGAHGHPAGECWLNSVGGYPDFPHDQGEHGTHVMGTLTGLGVATEDTIGVAWNALWIACDAIGQGATPEFDNDIIEAFQWFADPDGDPATVDDVPDVVQNSWGVSEMFPGYLICDSRWWEVIDYCEAAGVVTCWSAGNEGPEPFSVRSPADRVTTPRNTFSVGAIDATNYGFPYPMANFSSRGPSRCDSSSIKPEVAAPGVDVYSSVPGGEYEQDGWSGTSMAGPHVAGVVALMREANPNLPVDTIKQILMQTAVDHGDPGEDNDYGWGVVDAYEAVLQAMSGFGTLAGTVTNASNGGTPLLRAMVRALEGECETATGVDGSYAMSLSAGTYTVTASHPSFEAQTVYDIVINEDATTTLDFSLIDIAPPVITHTTDYRSTDDTIGPYEIESTVTDFSALEAVTLYYRLDGGPWETLAMNPAGEDLYAASIPGQPYVSLIEYYVEAEDIVHLISTDPPLAPVELYSFWVAPLVTHFEDSMESGAAGWMHAVVTPGFNDQWHLSLQRNHTPGGSHSWKCGDQGQGTYAAMLDAGLVTPEIELGADAYLHYWQWMEIDDYPPVPGYTYDGALLEISAGGSDWEQVFPDSGYTYKIQVTGAPGPFPAETEVYAGTYDWHEVHFDLSAYTGPVELRLRFGTNVVTQMEGWYIDDILIEGFHTEFSGIETDDFKCVLLLRDADPNPFDGTTTLRYQLPANTAVLLQVFDLSGRLVRTLASRQQQPGLYSVSWDGRDAAHRRVPSGIYLTRLQAGAQSVTARAVLIR